jgi:hypothetical protein
MGSISTLLAFYLVSPAKPRGPVPDAAALSLSGPSGVEVVSLGRLKPDLTPIAHIRIETDSRVSGLRVRGTGARISTVFRIIVLHLLRPHYEQCRV